MSKITMTAKYAVEVQPFQSTEETRYYLNGFCVDRNPSGGIRIVATDGNVLVCFHDAAGSLDGEQLIVRLDKQALATIKASVKGDRNTVTLEIEGDANNASASACRVLINGLVVATFNDVLIDGTFPAYERVIPNEYATLDAAKEPGGQRAQFNKIAPFSIHTALLALFGKLSPEVKKPWVDVVRVQDHVSPHLVFIPGRADVFGVIMPVANRGATNQGVPNWYRQPVAKAKLEPVDPTTAMAAAE